MQTILVSIVISAACVYLAWKMYVRFFKKDVGCGGCAMNKMEEK